MNVSLSLRGVLPACRLILAMFLATGLVGAEQPDAAETETAIRAHLTFLADDLLEGRGAGSRGFDLAAHYVATQFSRLGLTPGGEFNRWFQSVPLVESRRVEESARCSIVRDGTTTELEYAEGFLMRPDPVREQSHVRAPVAFVGFGVSAPDLDYDDYDGVDVKGHVLLMLSGAPARFPSSQRAYHSHSARKRELAVRHGGVGVITVATPLDERRRPWPVRVRGDGFPSMNWIGADGLPNAWAPEILGNAFLSRSGAEALMEAAGENLGTFFENSALAIVQSKRLPVEIDLAIESAHRQLQSPNVAGILPGTDPELRHEYIVCTAHLDGLGISEPINGDAINNGAMDNAIGVSILLETASQLARERGRLKRSILFLALTAEEKGLLGSDYFAAHPTVPADQIVANVNVDMPILLFPPRDVVAFGAEHSTLGKIAVQAVAQAGLELIPDPKPEEVFFIRSDQYSFVKRGIPALYLNPGTRSADPAFDGEALQRQFLSERYHRPNDDLDQDFSWSGAASFVRMNASVIRAIARDPDRPEWNPGDFFGKTFPRAGSN